MSGGVSIKYNNEEIASMSSSGTKVLLTMGKYCNSDIQLDYEKPAPAVVPLHAYAAGTYTPPTGKGYGSVVYGPEEITDAVRFFDYDGTLLHQYTATQFLALSSMPSNPSHTGLTAQGWNWSLAEAQEYVSQWGFLDIGQMYVTSSGKTEIDMVLSNATLNLYLTLGINGEVKIEWGDGTSTNQVGSSISTLYTIQHTYQNKGQYTLKIENINGTYSLKTDKTNGGCIDANETTLVGEGPFFGVIKHVRIGSNVVGIDTNAFYRSNTLKDITIPSSVTVIGNNAFQYCFSLTSVTIPEGVTSIELNAFYDCRSLSSVTIPSSVTSIGNYAFINCTSLSSVTMPEGVTLIGAEIFQNTYSLFRKIFAPYGIYYKVSDSYEFSSSITSIESYTFQNCQSLSSVTIPSSVTSIGTYAFQNCYSLTSVTIPSSVISIDGYAFRNCYSLTSVTIPSSVTSIGNYAFASCISLSFVTIPERITSIGSYTFQNCQSLSSVTIPSSVTSIGTYAFQNCQSLFSVTIPSSVTSIGNNAFSDCYGMGEYHFQSTTPPTLGTNVFQNIHSNCKIYVPSASLSTYQSATNWSTYASYMVGE